MTFFARPNLDDIQFKQLTGSTLTLSGQTRIIETNGLTLSDGAGSNIVITAKNASSHVGWQREETCRQGRRCNRYG